MEKMEFINLLRFTEASWEKLKEEVPHMKNELIGKIDNFFETINKMLDKDDVDGFVVYFKFGCVLNLIQSAADEEAERRKKLKAVSP